MSAEGVSKFCVLCRSGEHEPSIHDRQAPPTLDESLIDIPGFYVTIVERDVTRDITIEPPTDDTTTQAIVIPLKGGGELRFRVAWLQPDDITTMADKLRHALRFEIQEPL